MCHSSLLKRSHHGSRGNTSRELLDLEGSTGDALAAVRLMKVGGRSCCNRTALAAMCRSTESAVNTRKNLGF